ncbi:MAG: glycosyltransferase family 2 protein [Pirellulaceae bacterium]|jgi:glycosyltransferase involved in cell wall biosynthesis|nr:glycosyltransferase family 2 protein [Pirellulaceae bacterium]MDP7014192.1 glycosyltransferase family 2 protein [Pirellulaceae bacterium]
MCEVTVVLPVFNAAPTIGRAIGSILDQTLHDIRLIVVDDGSTDGTADAVRQVGDPRLRFVPRTHGGVAAATNAAVQLADTPLIARMDADDFAHPTKLERQLHLLTSHDFDAVGCRVRIVDEAGQASRSMSRYERWINDETIESEQIAALRFVEFPLVNPTILARRSYFELGFRDDELPEDYDLMLRAAAAGMRFGKVREILFDWSDGADRLTRNDSRYSADAFARCRRRHLLTGPLNGAPLVDLWGVGQTGKPWLRWLQENNIEVRRAYEVDGRKVGGQMHGVNVVHPSDLAGADGTPLLIAVGADGARPTILPQIEKRNYVCGRDAWFVA